MPDENPNAPEAKKPERKPYYSLFGSRSASKERYSIIDGRRGSVSRRPEDFPKGEKVLVVRRKDEQGKPTLSIEEYKK